MRPGETLHEELLADADATIATPIAPPRIARLHDRGGAIQRVADAPQRSGSALKDESVHALLREFVPEYVQSG